MPSLWEFLCRLLSSLSRFSRKRLFMQQLLLSNFPFLWEDGDGQQFRNVPFPSRCSNKAWWSSLSALRCTGAPCWDSQISSNLYIIVSALRIVTRHLYPYAVLSLMTLGTSYFLSPNYKVTKSGCISFWTPCWCASKVNYSNLPVFLWYHMEQNLKSRFW